MIPPQLALLHVPFFGGGGAAGGFSGGATFVGLGLIPAFLVTLGTFVMGCGALVAGRFGIGYLLWINEAWFQHFDEHYAAVGVEHYPLGLDGLVSAFLDPSSILEVDASLLWLLGVVLGPPTDPATVFQMHHNVTATSAEHVLPHRSSSRALGSAQSPRQPHGHVVVRCRCHYSRKQNGEPDKNQEPNRVVDNARLGRASRLLGLCYGQMYWYPKTNECQDGVHEQAEDQCLDNVTELRSFPARHEHVQSRGRQEAWDKECQYLECFK